MSHHSAEYSDEFLAQLKQDLVCRRVGRALARLEEHRHLLTSFDPKKKNAGRLAGYLAQWVDVGFQRPGLVKEIVGKFSRACSARTCLYVTTCICAWQRVWWRWQRSPRTKPFNTSNWS